MLALDSGQAGQSQSAVMHKQEGSSQALISRHTMLQSLTTYGLGRRGW